MNDEPPTFSERFFGLFGGIITGLFLSVGLLLVIDIILEIGNGSDKNFMIYCIFGMSSGIALGLFYPKKMMKIGGLLGLIIPGL